MAVLAAVTVLTAGLVTAAPPSTAAGVAGTLSIQPKAAIAGESVIVRGTLPPRRARSVVLQRRNGTSWVAVSRKTSRTTGGFRFAVTARPTTTTYRVFAPRARIGGRVYAAVRTPTRKLTVQPQTASLSAPTEAYTGSNAPIEATFGPVRVGRPVALEKRVGSTWTTVANGTESSTGVASFSVTRSAEGTDTYRAVAQAWQGATAKTTSLRQIYFVEAPDTTPPGPITGLLVTGTTTDTVDFSWTNPTAADLYAIEVRRAAGSTPPATRNSGLDVGYVYAPDDTFQDYGLDQGTTYSYSFFAVDEEDNASTRTSKTITTELPDTTPPGKITGLIVTSSAASGVSFTWTNPTDADFAEVWVARADGPTPPATRDDGSVVDVLDKPAHAVDDPYVNPDTQYSYSFFTVDEEGNTSAPVSSTLTTGGLPPDPVWDLSATTVTATSATLEWTNPTNPDFSGVMIRRSVGAVPPASPTAGTLVTDKAAPATTHTQTGLTPQTQYTYALFAHDVDGNYAQGTPVTITTAEADPPGPVTGLSRTGTTASTASFSWTNPNDSDFAGVMVRRAVGETPPGSATAGVLAGLVSKPGSAFVDTGLTPGTRYAYAFFAYDTSDNKSTAATTDATTAAIGTGDWLQSRADGERRSWTPNETTLHTGNAASVTEEWDARPGVPAISGTNAYVYGADEYAGTSVRVYNLVSGALTDEFSTPTCSAGQVALTATLVVLTCSSSIRAYARAAGHALIWDTASTDPGQAIRSFFLSGTTMVVQANDRVAAYRLSDGQRLWQQLLPSGAGQVNDVAVSGTTVLVAYDDRLRALSLTAGGQLWSVSGAGSNEVIAAGGWAYVHTQTEVRRYAIAGGAAGWSVSPEHGVYRLLAADADTVYVWSAVFDFGPPSPSILRALRTSNGSERWNYDVPTRVGAVGVTGDLVWLTTSDIYSQGRYSALIGLVRATGEEKANIAFTDNMYGGPDAFAVGGGKILLDQGGSFGGSVPHRLRVFGVRGVLPTITTGALTLGRVGTPYQHQLTAKSPPESSTWSVVAGSLPAGLSLSPAGLISGTPTSAGSAQVTIKVTSGNGRTAQTSFPLAVVGSTAATWTANGRNATRNPFEPGTGLLDIEAAPTFAPRWTTQAPGASVTWDVPHVVADGNRIYTVGRDGLLKAFDATGSAADRPPLWAVGADAGGLFRGTITLTGDRIIANGQDGSLYAIRASDGFKLWRTVATNLDDDAIVVGSVVATRDTSNKVRAFSRADGSPLWGGNPTTMTDFQTPLSSDGTRLFAVADCVLYAFSPATGAEIWHADMRGKLVDNCFAGYMESAAPIVVGGKVYASEVGSRMIADAATGSVIRTLQVNDYYFTEGVVVGGIWMYFDNDTIAAMDVATGRIVWRKPWVVSNDSQAPHLSASGDLIVVTTLGNVAGIDRRTGESVWDGGAFNGYAGTATIGGSKIFVATSDGVRAYGPL